jgi:predicted metal-dependent phosphoesterase TrpH
VRTTLAENLALIAVTDHNEISNVAAAVKTAAGTPPLVDIHGAISMTYVKVGTITRFSKYEITRKGCGAPPAAGTVAGPDRRHSL